MIYEHTTDEKAADTSDFNELGIFNALWNLAKGGGYTIAEAKRVSFNVAYYIELRLCKEANYRKRLTEMLNNRK